MIRKALELLNPQTFVVPQNFGVDEVLVGDVIRETDNHNNGRPLTPVLYNRDHCGSAVIVGNIAAYLVAMQLSIKLIPAMRVE